MTAPQPPVTVLYIITSTDVGGAERMLERTVGGLDRERFVPVVLSIAPLGAIGHRIAASGVPVHTLELAPGGAGPLSGMGAVLRARRLIRRIRPAIIHGFMVHADVLGRIAGRLAGVPVVIGSLRSMHIGGPRREWLMRLTDPLADRVTAVGAASGAHQIAQRSLKAKKLVVIHNGIELEKFSQPPAETLEELRLRFRIDPGQRVLLHVGRLEPVKRQAALVRAFGAASRDRSDWSLLIAGDGPLESELREIAQSAGLGGRFILPGRIDDIVPIYYLADAFALSSAWEGMPSVVLEAMAAGRPVVSTAVGSVPEMIEPGRTGWLCPPEDEPALTECFVRLLATPGDELAAMGRAARARIETDFTMERNLGKTMELYAELLREKRLG